MSGAPTYEAAAAAGDWNAVESILSAAGPVTARDVLDRLSLIQYERQDFRACERTLERLLTLAPDAPLEIHQRLSKAKAADGRPDEARAVIARAAAAHPAATEFVAAHADMLPPDEAVRELKKHLHIVGGDPGRTAYTLLRISTTRAAGRRAERGLPPHGTSWPDTYQWPDHEALPELKDALTNEIVAGSTRASVWADLACVALADGNWERAEECFAKLRKGPKRSAADFHAFGRAFHTGLDALGDAEIVAGLAPVERLTAPAPQSGVSIFIGSDPVYFARFTLPLLRGAEAAAMPLDVNVHILDGTPAVWAEIAHAVGELKSLRVTLTTEASGAASQGGHYARLYYHAVRYVRVFEELKRARRPLWVLDADVRLLRDPRALLASIERYDLAINTRPAELSPSLKLTAACVGLAPTPRGLEFARRVAAYITHWKNKGAWGWGIDQVALFSSYAHMSAEDRQPSTLFLDDTAVNWRTGDNGVIKLMPGMDKYSAGSAA